MSKGVFVKVTEVRVMNTKRQQSTLNSESIHAFCSGFLTALLALLPIFRHVCVIQTVSFSQILNKNCHGKSLILWLLLVFKGNLGEVLIGRNSLSYC